MRVIVHYPKDEKSIKELQQNVVNIHMEAVIDYLNKLTCPKEQKIDLLQIAKESTIDI